MTIERFANFTKEVDKIKQRKTWLAEDIIVSLHNTISDEKAKMEELYKKQLELALNLDPVFHLDLVKGVDADIDRKLKELRRTPKPKNETQPKDDFNIEDLKDFDPSMFDPSKLNPEQM